MFLAKLKDKKKKQPQSNAIDTKENKKLNFFDAFPNVIKANVEENGAYNYLEWGIKIKGKQLPHNEKGICQIK